MHNVVHAGGVLEVATVDNHRVLELLGPSLIVHTHSVHVGVGHQHQLVHDTVKLVVIGDGDRRALDSPKAGAVGHLVQFNLKVLVLLVDHVVDDGNLEVALRFAMLKMEDALATLVVLAADGGLVHRLPLDVNVAVGSVLPEQKRYKIPSKT